MDEYIKRQQVIDELNKEGYTKNMRVHRHILDIPSSDVKEVVRAHWIKVHGMAPPELHGKYVCSVCGSVAMLDWKRHKETPTNFCARCGAKMEGVSE